MQLDKREKADKAYGKKMKGLKWGDKKNVLKGNWGTSEQRIWQLGNPKHPFHN